MKFDFSALKVLPNDDDKNLRVSEIVAAVFISRSLEISVTSAMLVLSDNFPGRLNYRPSEIGELIRAFYLEEESPWNAFCAGDPDEHDGE